MKYLILFLFFTLPFFSFGQEDPVCKDLDFLVELESSQFNQLKNGGANPLTQDYDVVFHRLEWEVDPAVKYIKGSVTTYFIPKVVDFQQLNFDFNNTLTINKISYRDQNPNYVQTDKNLQINLPAIIPRGQLDSIRIDYEGVPVSAGFGSFETGWHNGAPMLWTLSEPYGARSWWPCKQDLTDKIDSIDIFITTPSEYRAGSNGLLISEVDAGDDHTTYFWKHRYSIPAYLISMAVSNYDVFTEYVYLGDGDSVPIVNYVFPEDLQQAKSKLHSTIEQMELFNELFGDYPFKEEKYGHAQFGFGGGMEHQTMSSMGSFSYGLQAHELAHQWFGDKITCGSWEDIWLNEGFATYLAALTKEFLTPDPHDWHQWKEGAINFVTSEPDGSTWVSDTNSVGRIFSGRLSYNKGALILHMLRWKLGDEDFFQGIRNYLNDPNLAYGYARTTDLQQHLELQSGQDLTEFLKDWFYSEGYPGYHLFYEVQEKRIKITLEQSPSDLSVGFFEMPVPVKLSDGMNDTLVVLDHTFSGQEFDIHLSFQPSTVELDPDLWLLSANNIVEENITSTGDTNPSVCEMKIFPNPSFDNFTVQFESARPLEQITYLEVVDVNGISWFKMETAISEFQIPSLHWPSGVYLLNIQTKEERVAKKMIKF